MARVFRSTAFVVFALLCAAGIPGHAQQAASDQRPVFRAGINFVRVDVIVTDKNGNAVTDLTSNDFEVIEQKTPQKVETFKLVSLDGGLISSTNGPPRQIRSDDDEETEASRDDVRLFAMFLDDYHVRRESSLTARSQLARFIETQLGPTDMIGLMYPLQPTASVRMTRNHEAVSTALRQFIGRKYDYTPKNATEERYAYYPAEVVEKIRNQVSMSALKALILRMGALKEGRKALILVSEGYNAMLPPQMRDPIAAAPGLANPLRNDPDAGVGSVAEGRAAFSSNADMELDLQAIWDLANRNNVAIYAVDPRGLATGEFGIDQNIGGITDRAYLNSTMDTLRTLAVNTDGRAILNRNDLTMGMKQIVRDQTAYYLLGYSSSFTATDGKFHEIKVTVKRPGLQVRARKGYWAFTTEDAAKATAPPKPQVASEYATALAAVVTPVKSSRVVRTWVGTARGVGGKTRVTFVWEPIPHAAGDQVRPGDAPTRVSLMAVGADGTPYFRGRLPSTPPVTPAVAGAKVSFDVPPGKVQLRVSIENATNDVLDTESRELDVPDLTAPQVILGTPSLFRARTLRDVEQMKADPQATPTVGREFSRAERVFVRVPLYAPGDVAPAISARMLNRAAESIGALPVVTSASGPDLREIDLSLAPLAPGEYLIEISASGAGEPVKAIVGFRVTS